MITREHSPKAWRRTSITLSNLSGTSSELIPLLSRMRYTSSRTPRPSNPSKAEPKLLVTISWNMKRDGLGIVRPPITTHCLSSDQLMGRSPFLQPVALRYLAIKRGLVVWERLYSCPENCGQSFRTFSHNHHRSTS